MSSSHVNPAYQKIFIYNPVKQIHHSLSNQTGGRSIFFQIGRTVGVLWNAAAISVCLNFSMILLSPHRVFQIINIVTDCQNNLIRHKSFIHQIKNQQVDHFPNYKFCFFKRIRTLQHLTGADTVAFRFVGFNICNRTRLPAPGMVNQQFRIDAEKLIQKFLVIVVTRFTFRAAGYITHRIKAMFFQLLCIPFSHPPEISQWAM